MISALTTEIGKSGIFLCHNIPFSQACFGKIPVQGKKVIKEYTFKVRNYEQSLNSFFFVLHTPEWKTRCPEGRIWGIVNINRSKYKNLENKFYDCFIRNDYSFNCKQHSKS